jgi:hypothetical protein
VHLQLTSCTLLLSSAKSLSSLRVPEWYVFVRSLSLSPPKCCTELRANSNLLPRSHARNYHQRRVSVFVNAYVVQFGACKFHISIVTVSPAPTYHPLSPVLFGARHGGTMTGSLLLRAGSLAKLSLSPPVIQCTIKQDNRTDLTCSHCVPATTQGFGLSSQLTDCFIRIQMPVKDSPYHKRCNNHVRAA